MPTQESLQLAAQAWTYPATSKTEMDADLAEAFADIMDGRIRALEAELAEANVRKMNAETALGKALIGALDYCKEHGLMRKSDVEWPCGMCEKARADRLEADLKIADDALHDMDEQRHRLQKELDLVRGDAAVDERMKEEPK